MAARKSAEVRREEIVAIAFRQFGEGGYHGTSTEAIAREAGISQPYLFRLFGTKKELFLACVDVSFEGVAAVFAEAAASPDYPDKLTALGCAYEERLLPDRHSLLFQMQSQTTSDPEIRAYVRERFNALRGTVAELAGVSEDETWHFFADGMLLNVVAMLELDWTPPARDGMIFRHRRAILIVSAVLVVVAAALALPVFSELGNENDFDDPAAESVQARRAVTEATGALPAPTLIALVRLPAPADATASQARIASVVRAIEGEGVARVAAYRPGGDRRLVSRDGRSTYVAATLTGSGPRARIEAALDDTPGVTLGGLTVAAPEIGDRVSSDIARAELIAFPILFLLSLIVFRSAVSALLPLAVGGTTILLSFVAIRFVNSSINPMSIYALNLINGLGLGLAIDYSLFMVSRFREELASGADREVALATTLRTAGRVVAFSAVTVAAALAALIVFRQRFLYSMGVGGALCALIAAAVSLTLLPALLGVLGERVNAVGPRRWKEAIAREAAGERSGFWYRHSQRVMRRPVLVAVSASALLIALGLPFLRIEFTGIDPTVLPRSAAPRIVEDALRRDFPPSETSPIYIAVDPAVPVAQLREYAARLPAPVEPPRVTRGRIDVFAPGPPLGAAAKRTVDAVRAVQAPFEVKVGGSTAAFLDQQASLRAHLPLALAILAATTLIILFAMTRSVVLPFKALVMNLLSLCAAFGLLVLVFQDGHLDWLFGFESQGAIESSQPVLLFAVAFGLSTDYGVFLLGRIKELHDSGLPNEEAVALGLQRTGRIVTFAALLMVIAIGCFVTADIIFVKQLGFGVAAAVLIDATIVRALLVPALMRLLGDWNWWAPRPLLRLLPAS